MMKGFSSIIFCAVIILTGCANNKQSLTSCSDWRSIGLADGKNGEPAELFAQRKRLCDKKGLAVDVVQFTEGYIEGIKKYCTYDGGYEAGKNGKKYKAGVCVGATIPEFVKGYQIGWGEFQANNKMKSIKNDSESQGRTVKGEMRG